MGVLFIGLATISLAFSINGAAINAVGFSCPAQTPGCEVAHCFARPCSVNTCPKYPAAQCCDNYCGGCNADFYVSGIPVDCTCTKTITPCFVDPCDVTSCPAFPDATCLSNYCGGCNAEFYFNARRVDCDLPSCSDSKKCNAGVTQCHECVSDSECTAGYECCMGCSGGQCVPV